MEDELHEWRMARGQWRATLRLFFYFVHNRFDYSRSRERSGQVHISAYDRVRLRSTAVRRTRSLLSLVGNNERTNERSERVHLTAIERSRTRSYTLMWPWPQRPNRLFRILELHKECP